MVAILKGLVAFSVLSLLAIANLFASGGDLRLIEAVKKNDAAAVRSLLKERVDVNVADADGSTALAWAAHKNDLGTAELLIGAGANANAANEYGGTPLSVACGEGNSAMVERLLKAGANPNAALKSGETPLMTAAAKGSLEAVKSLLSHGADANAKETSGGQTALMWAVAERHPQVARLLIEHGALVGARSKNGFTPLLFAAQQGDLESAKFLLEAGADVNGSKPLSKNHPPRPIGAPIALRGTPEGTTPLLMALATGHEQLAAFLLEKGADPKAADEYGFTPLHFAVWGRNTLELVRVLLAKGVNANARIVQEPPLPLLTLLGGKRFATIATGQGDMLFDGDGSPSVLGASPLWMAAQIGNVKAMRVLLASGADPLLPTQQGTTPLMAAAGVGRLIAWKDEHKLSAMEENRNNLEAVQLLWELGGNQINAAGQNGWTALHGAAYTGENDIVKFLVAKGANLNAMDNYGQTPLSIVEVIATVALQKKDVNLALFAGRQVNEDTRDLLLKLGAAPLASSGVQIYTAGADTSAAAAK